MVVRQEEVVAAPYFSDFLLHWEEKLLVQLVVPVYNLQ